RRRGNPHGIGKLPPLPRLGDPVGIAARRLLGARGGVGTGQHSYFGQTGGGVGDWVAPSSGYRRSEPRRVTRYRVTLWSGQTRKPGGLFPLHTTFSSRRLQSVSGRARALRPLPPDGSRRTATIAIPPGSVIPAK